MVDGTGLGMARILIVDDQDNARGMLSDMLQAEGYDVDQAESGEAAHAMVAKGGYDLVITDLRMGDVGGLEVVQRTREASPLTEVIVMTAFGTIEDAVEAMRFGARDFVQKTIRRGGASSQGCAGCPWA